MLSSGPIKMALKLERLNFCVFSSFVNCQKLTYFEEHDWVLACVVHEEVLEIVGARGQHHFVAFQGGAIYGQSHVTKCFNLNSLEYYFRILFFKDSLE